MVSWCRLRERSESRYGQIVRALLKAYSTHGYEFTSQQLTDIINEGKEPKYCITQKAVSSVIIALNIPRRRTNRQRTIVIDDTQLYSLLKKYGWLEDEDVLDELRSLGISKGDTSDRSDILQGRVEKEAVLTTP